MNALPAKVAGVERIVCVTPPTKDGTLDAAILAACKIAGVDEIYTVGGAQAVGALAYGTESIAPVAKITGPGNAYVAAAKKIVSGDVGIDMIAGPSEVCVVADETADPSLVAIDLMAQAEHDPLAACYLVVFSDAYADAVEAAIEKHLASSTREDITRASLDDQGLIVVCPTMDAAMEAVNVIAPEHLELHIENAMDRLGSIRNAGAIFLGAWTPEAVGDYVAGPNHTLPTGGTARYASPLSVEEFVKKSSIIAVQPRCAEKRCPRGHADRASRGVVGRTPSRWRCVAPRSATRRAGSMDPRKEGSVNNVRASAPQLQGLVPYDPKYLPARAMLSANENPRDVDEEVRKKIIRAVKKVPFNRYPDPLANDLRDVIAEANGLTRECVLVGNGGDELLFNLALAWGGPGRTFLNMPPTFSVYAANARLTGTTVVDIARRADFSIDEEAVLERLSQGDVDFTVIASPNNPTGLLAPQRFLEQVLEATDALVMIDEAYFEFSRQTVRPLLDKHVNLVILRTFSKAFAWRACAWATSCRIPPS